jgi:hypothetical protein
LPAATEKIFICPLLADLYLWNVISTKLHCAVDQNWPFSPDFFEFLQIFSPDFFFGSAGELQITQFPFNPFTATHWSHSFVCHACA